MTMTSSTQVLENIVTNSGSGFEDATVVLSVYAVCATVTILVLVLVLVYFILQNEATGYIKQAGNT